MDASSPSSGPAWFQRGGRAAAAYAVLCELPEPPWPEGMASLQAIVDDHIAGSARGAEIVVEYSGGLPGWPARLVALYPPRSTRDGAEKLAAALQRHDAARGVRVCAPAAGDPLPPVPPAP